MGLQRPFRCHHDIGIKFERGPRRESKYMILVKVLIKACADHMHKKSVITSLVHYIANKRLCPRSSCSR